MRRIPIAIVSLVILLFTCGGPDSACAFQQSSLETWTRLRGENGDGLTSGTNLPDDLADPANILWKAAVPGRGWSSPVILENEIWMTTALETGLPSAGDSGDNGSGEAEETTEPSIALKAVCLDRTSGQLLTVVDLFDVKSPPPIHNMNSYASPSPVADEYRVYCHFGTFGTAAIDRQTREVAWRNNENVIEHETGPGSSPIVYRDKLIFHCDGTDQQYLCALETETGKQVWRTGRSGEMEKVGMYKKAFCTPLIIERHGQKELVSPAANWVYGYDPDTGAELWKVSYGQTGFSVVTLPLVVADTLYVCTSFMDSTMLAIDLTPQGPLDEKAVKWRYKGQVPNMPTPLILDEAIYFVSDRGVISCLDSKTGERHWQERLGRAHSSSPVFVDGRILIGDHDGILYAIEPDTSEMKLAGKYEFDSRIMATPAALGERLFIRTEKSLYCFGKSQDGP
jgi:outer membrane protein assembly factor BamB